MKNLIITITGPSASGKSTLERALCSLQGFCKVVSHTTRAPRAGEFTGDDYHFISRDDFRQMAEQGQFVETVGFGGNLYGIHRNEFDYIFSKGEIAVVVCEPVGQAQINLFRRKKGLEKGFEILPIFITNPAEVRYARLVDRFLADIDGLGSNSGLAKALAKASFVRRLTTISEVESRWGDEPWRYSMNIKEFNADNIDSVVSAVMAKCSLRDW